MSGTIKDLDDVDDELFTSRKPPNYIFADKKSQDINERTNKTLANTLSIIHETQQVGQSTLENLATQRETLERVEDDLDDINAMTRASQKHLNNMKSFFGGIKVLFGSKSSTTNLPIMPATKGAIPRSQTFASKPSNIPSSSSGVDKNFACMSTASTSSGPPITRVGDEPQDEFEATLSKVGFALSILKDQAMDLGNEIGDQNCMLDRITEKSERANDSIKHQERQIQQLLKK